MRIFILLFTFQCFALFDAYGQTMIFPANDGLANGLYAYNTTTENVGRIYDKKGGTTNGVGIGPFGRTILFQGDYVGFFDLGHAGLALCSFDANGLTILDSGSGISQAGDMVEYNGKLYFLGIVSGSTKVFEYDPGTTTTTEITASLHDAYQAHDLVTYDDGGGEQLYFGARANSANSYADLYRYNGTTLSIAPNFNFSTPYHMAVFNGELHMGACPSGSDDDVRSVKYDGSSSSQVLETNTNTSHDNDDYPLYYQVHDSKLFFRSTQSSGTAASEPNNDVLYSVNTSGTVTVEYDPPSTTSNGPSQMFVTGGNLYFIADDTQNSDSELFRYNSTGNVTRLTNTTNQRFIQSAQPYDGGVFFWQERNVSMDDEPYFFDLSDNSYTLIADLNDGGSSYNSSNFWANLEFSDQIAPFVYVPATSALIGKDQKTSIAADIEVSEIDNNSLTAASIEIESGFQAGDSLFVTDQHGVTSSYNSSTGVLTLTISGSATPSEIQDIFASAQIKASNVATKTITFKVTDSDGNQNDVTNTNAAQIDVESINATVATVPFDTQPAGLSTSTSAYVGTFSISEASLGTLTFITTDDGLGTSNGSLTASFSASEYGMLYEASNQEMEVQIAGAYSSPQYLVFSATNDFNFYSFDAIDRDNSTFDIYEVTGLLDGSQVFQETINREGDQSTKVTYSLNSTNKNELVDEIRINPSWNTESVDGFSAFFDNLVFVIPNAATTPTVATTSISTFDDVSATLGGNVTDDGGASVTDRGVVYNTSGSPTTSDTQVQIGTGTGVFSQSVGSLTPNTTYYIRAYAINSEGTSYGSEESFTTSCSSTCTSSSPLIKTTATHQSASQNTVGDWTYFCTCDGDLLLALDLTNAPTAVIPDNGVKVKIGATESSYYTPGTGFITNEHGAALINREWDVSPTTQPGGGEYVGVRFFYSNTEYGSLNTTLDANDGVDDWSISSVNQLDFFKVTNGALGEFPAVSAISGSDVNLIDYQSGSPSTTTWTDGTHGASDHYAEYQVTSFSGGGGGAGGGGGGGTGLTGTFPVEMAYFKAQAEGRNVLLEWATLSEINNKGFYVQRKETAEWQEVAFVPERGHAKRSYTYQYTDQPPAGNTHYTYRLAQVDWDGSTSYSEQVEVYLGAMPMALYPNPNTGSFVLDLGSTRQRVQLRFLSVDGKVVGIQRHHRLSRVEVESGLAPGLYFLEIQADGQPAQTIKVVMQ